MAGKGPSQTQQAQFISPLQQLSGGYAQPQAYAYGQAPPAADTPTADTPAAVPFTVYAPSYAPLSASQQAAVNQSGFNVAQPVPYGLDPGASAGPIGAPGMTIGEVGNAIRPPNYVSPSGVTYNAIGNQVGTSQPTTVAPRTVAPRYTAEMARRTAEMARSRPDRSEREDDDRGLGGGGNGGGGGGAIGGGGLPVESPASDIFRKAAYAAMMGGNFYGGVIPPGMRSTAPPGDVWGLLNSMGIQNPQNITPQQAMQQASTFGLSPFGTAAPRRG